MGAGASSAGGANGHGVGPNHKNAAPYDLRGERYLVEVDFIAPPDCKRLSNNLAIYFKGTHAYSPRILPSKVDKQAKDRKRLEQFHSSSKNGKKREKQDKSENVFDAKLVCLGGIYYRYSFEFRDNVNYGDIGIFWVRNVGTEERLRIQQAKVTKVMSGGLQSFTSEGERETYTFPCHCNLLPKTEKHFFEGRAHLPSTTPFYLIKWRSRELKEKEDSYTFKEWKEGLPNTWQVEGEEDFTPEHQSGLFDIKAQAADLLLAMDGPEGRLVRSNEKWDCVSHLQREQGGSSSDADKSLVSQIFKQPKGEATATATAGGEEEEEGQESTKEESNRIFPCPSSASAFSKSYWRNDVHFARQFLQGAHAEMLVACKDVSQIPEWLMRKKEFTRALAALQEGTPRINKHIVQEIAHGRVFLLDLENVSQFYSTIDAEEKKKFLALGPLCVFYLCDDPDRRFSSNIMALLPLVITLDAQDSESPVYSPLDDPWLWQLAKAFVSSADAQVHFTVSLLLNTCVGLEPWAISLHESLSTMHPLWKLLYPYMRYKCSESLGIKSALFGDSGILEGMFPLGEEGVTQLLTEAIQDWSLEDMAFPMTLAMRGLDGTDKLPEYPYRDDGLLIWCCVSDFVTSYLDCYYAEDEDVEQDYEVQNFLKNALSLHRSNANEEDKLDEEEMDALKVSTKEELASMSTTLIWLCTGYQTGLLKGLYDSMGFVPDRPIFMSEMAPYEKPPEEETFTEKEFLDHLPSKGATASSVAILFALANFKECTPSLSSKAYDNKVRNYVVDAKALEAVKAFEGNMAKIEKIIEQRNLKRDEEYKWMKPSEIFSGAVIQ